MKYSRLIIFIPVFLFINFTNSFAEGLKVTKLGDIIRGTSYVFLVDNDSENTYKDIEVKYNFDKHAVIVGGENAKQVTIPKLAPKQKKVLVVEFMLKPNDVKAQLINSTIVKKSDFLKAPESIFEFRDIKCLEDRHTRRFSCIVKNNSNSFYSDGEVSGLLYKDDKLIFTKVIPIELSTIPPHKEKTVSLYFHTNHWYGNEALPAPDDLKVILNDIKVDKNREAREFPKVSIGKIKILKKSNKETDQVSYSITNNSDRTIHNVNISLECYKDGELVLHKQSVRAKKNIYGLDYDDIKYMYIKPGETRELIAKLDSTDIKIDDVKITLSECSFLSPKDSLSLNNDCKNIKLEGFSINVNEGKTYTCLKGKVRNIGVEKVSNIKLLCNIYRDDNIIASLPLSIKDRHRDFIKSGTFFEYQINCGKLGFKVTDKVEISVIKCITGETKDLPSRSWKMSQQELSEALRQKEKGKSYKIHRDEAMKKCLSISNYEILNAKHPKGSNEFIYTVKNDSEFAVEFVFSYAFYKDGKIISKGYGEESTDGIDGKSSYIDKVRCKNPLAKNGVKLFDDVKFDFKICTIFPKKTLSRDSFTPVDGKLDISYQMLPTKNRLNNRVSALVKCINLTGEDLYGFNLEARFYDTDNALIGFRTKGCDVKFFAKGSTKILYLGSDINGEENKIERIELIPKKIFKLNNESRFATIITEDPKMMGAKVIDQLKITDIKPLAVAEGTSNFSYNLTNNSKHNISNFRARYVYYKDGKLLHTHSTRINHNLTAGATATFTDKHYSQMPRNSKGQYIDISADKLIIKIESCSARK